VYALYAAYRRGFRVGGVAPLGNWITGFVFIIFSLGIFVLINWVRMAIIVTSSIVTSLFIAATVLLFLLKPDNWQWGILGVSAFFPVIVLSLYSLIYFTRPKVKEQFK